MRGRFILPSGEAFTLGNIYADKSSLILEWLLSVGSSREDFSIREVAKDRNISVGLVQRVFGVLVLNGFLQTKGVRTAKKFFVKKPALLLKSWLEQYSIVKKCKIWTYRSGLQDKEAMLKTLKKMDLDQRVALGLHSAAEAYGYKNTNLETLELYLLDPAFKSHIEKALQLEPQERGYEVLLVEPYYKSLLKLGMDTSTGMGISPILLAYLDLYHFPLRGQEQAEFIAERAPEIKRIYKRN